MDNAYYSGLAGVGIHYAILLSGKVHGTPDHAMLASTGFAGGVLGYSMGKVMIGRTDGVLSFLAPLVGVLVFDYFLFASSNRVTNEQNIDHGRGVRTGWRRTLNSFGRKSSNLAGEDGDD